MSLTLWPFSPIPAKNCRACSRFLKVSLRSMTQTKAGGDSGPGFLVLSCFSDCIVCVVDYNSHLISVVTYNTALVSLEIRKRGDRSYLYFEYSQGGRRKYLYLGTNAQHRLDRFEKALTIIRTEIDKYSGLENKLFGLLFEEERRRLKRAANSNAS